MSLNQRTQTYSLAINEAIHQMMAADDSVFLMGQGVKSPWYVGNTTKSLLERFGDKRVIDTPVSENAITAAGVGAAVAGMRPIIVHPRMDFMLYATDPIINEAANWHYMFGGKSCVPVVIWGIINRGGEQAAQHSQALHALYAHIPGLKVVMPATPYDAKGLMIAAIKDDNPVIYIDNRELYGTSGHVPEEIYSVPIGKAAIRCEGRDITLVSVSSMIGHAIKAADKLKEENIDVEVIDLISIKPFDKALIFESVKKTGRLVVADIGWTSFGVAAEILATVSESLFYELKAPVKRFALADVPAPASSILEDEYYASPEKLASSIRHVMQSRIK